MDEKPVKTVSPLTVGWREWVALPGLGVDAIKGKLDTGARTSSLHTFFIEPFREGGKDMVRFGLYPLQKSKDIEVICCAEILDRRMTSDSGGKKELRYVISTTLSLGGMQWPIEVNLTNRENLMFRFLIGRSALKGRLLVDSGQSFVLGRTLARRYRTGDKRRKK
jgi:hypothetical protein